jgi:UDP-N-acetylmuramyl pentapeptide phosphotransferase/UDP-N-acetylglucosamine-1-phosphate transferase
MLYYLAVSLVPSFSPLNVLTYNTVRAGGAAFTAFAVSLIAGPVVIRWLRALKVGQFIRQEHVADLHALHKKKEGTPTMGGALMLLATLVSLLLWGRLTNPLLLMALGVWLALGAVGFFDDYIKLRRKHNKGLSARAKFTGQIAIGLLLGLFLYFNPVTSDRIHLQLGDIRDWDRLGQLLEGDLAPFLPETARPADGAAWTRESMLSAMNALIDDADLSGALGGDPATHSEETRALNSRKGESWSLRDTRQLNRLLLEDAYPDTVARGIANLHTKVELPGFKEFYIPMGAGYVVFVLLIIVGSSNAVNLTDGLDGLAIGASIISLMAYTAIAYVVSRADWSRYLFLVHVPDASELTVFGAALLGAGLGFMWFNCHPAEVFMGDTGSLALGGALGTMAVLTKQELLLAVVGGLFVLEAGSVILQVGSFKLRGKRIFKMAPLHHHFELMGWSESKVTIRFWIVSVLFAMMSLAALKLR